MDAPLTLKIENAKLLTEPGVLDSAEQSEDPDRKPPDFFMSSIFPTSCR